MAKASSQEFIGRNRPPRVDIKYDPGTGDPEVRLPFVMGVMADLSGASADELPDLANRDFLEIDAENFDARMKAAKPTVKFNVPNELTGEGNLDVDISFEKMDDFSPDAVAEKVAPLKRLLDKRRRLDELKATLTGETEKMLEELLESDAVKQEE